MKVSLIIFLIGFMTIAPSIWVGVKYFDGKVVDQPYETGLKYDEDKEFLKENGIKLGVINCSKSFEKASVLFYLDKKEGVQIKNEEFYITRPASDKEVKELVVRKADENIYEAIVPMKKIGYYLIKAKAEVNGRNIAIQKSFYVK